MTELIPITKSNIGGSIVDAVDGRTLYRFLESKQQFSDWIKNRIRTYFFVENQDFVTFHKIMKRSRTNEYTLTIDMAKELSMVENNEKGRQARRYFISCQNKLTKAKQAIIDMANDPIIGVRLKQLQLENQIKEQNKRLEIVEAKTNTSDVDHFSIKGYASLNNIVVELTQAAQLGRKATAICKSKGYLIEKTLDPRFGKVGLYPAHVLEELFKHIN